MTITVLENPSIKQFIYYEHFPVVSRHRVSFEPDVFVLLYYPVLVVDFLFLFESSLKKCSVASYQNDRCRIPKWPLSKMTVVQNDRYIIPKWPIFNAKMTVIAHIFITVIFVTVNLVENIGHFGQTTGILVMN